MSDYKQDTCPLNAFYCPWEKFDRQINAVMKRLLGEQCIKSALSERDGSRWHIVLFADFTDAEISEQIKQKLAELYSKYGYENELEEDWTSIESEWPCSKDRLHICREVSDCIIGEFYLDFPVAFTTASDEGIVFVKHINLLKKNFTVHTPDGTLLARASGDEEYPSITVELLREHGNVTLAMVEYTPGGEGIADYDPEHFEKMREQIDSIPKQRIMHQDGSPLTENDYVAATLDNLKEYRVTAGLVTRTWPDEANDMEYHRSTYHTGYKNTNNNKEEK